MTESEGARQFQVKLERLDALLREVDRWADPAAGAPARELVRAVLDIHEAGLERILGHLAAAGESGAAIRDACARDDIVGGLLLLHGLHPLDLETRVLQALDQVRPYLRTHSGDVELLDVSTDGVVHLRLTGSCQGCPSSAITMKQTIEEAILARAPDVTAVEVQGAVENPAVTPNGRMLVVLSGT
jgi:Fe-S cluster biogenesis protein NfuA